MHFAILLLILGLKLRWSARFDDEFRQKISSMCRVIVVRTRDSKYARTYSFHSNHVFVTPGANAESTVELVWRTPGIGVRTMLSTNVLDNISAIGKGDLSIEGSLGDALWFTEITG